MMAVARHVRVLLDGAYVAMEVASAVLSPVVLVMASCAAADAHTSHVNHPVTAASSAVIAIVRHGLHDRTVLDLQLEVSLLGLGVEE